MAVSLRKQSNRATILMALQTRRSYTRKQMTEASERGWTEDYTYWSQEYAEATRAQDAIYAMTTTIVDH